MTMWIQGDPEKLEQIANEDRTTMSGIADRAKENGCIAHRFYGTEGQILVVDEWPDPESFQRFFEGERGEIERMMGEIGASGEPGITFWRPLETHDEIGWD
jgi:hypothetical protein